MGAIFGKRPGSPKSNKKQPQVSKINENDRVVWELKKQRDKIRQYQKRISLQLEKERDLARKLIKDNKKDRALLLLRKKKFMESLLEKSDNNLLNIEQMISTVEDQQRQLEIIDTLKIGNDALKTLNEALDIDKIEDILEETKEGAEKQKEISRLISGGLDTENAESDEDLMKELERLTGESDAVALEPTDKLPEVELEKPDVSQLPDVHDLEPVEPVKDNQPTDQQKVKKSEKVSLKAS